MFAFGLQALDSFLLDCTSAIHDLLLLLHYSLRFELVCFSCARWWNKFLPSHHFWDRFSCLKWNTVVVLVVFFLYYWTYVSLCFPITSSVVSSQTTPFSCYHFVICENLAMEAFVTLLIVIPMPTTKALNHWDTRKCICLVVQVLQ